jgi:aspartate racemase
VPCNDVGEIVIRSEFLSPGYWKNPELTSATFRPDPQIPGQRQYFTGDLGALLPDGCLLFKGRKDFKMKIHGINVETAQLDASLRLHPSVRDAVSVPDEDESGERYLLVYVVPQVDSGLTITELRRFLLDILPVHMLSARFVFLDTLPLTPNGKVDRQALPRLTGNRPQIGQGFTAPRDEWERDLARICQTILGIDRIGVEDNLFDLGMDSLKAVRLATQIEKEFSANIPPGTLLRSPTIAQLAGALGKKTFSKSWSSLVAVQPGGSKQPFFWIHGDFSNAFLAGYVGPDQPLYALDHQSQDGNPALACDSRSDCGTLSAGDAERPTQWPVLFWGIFVRWHRRFRTGTSNSETGGASGISVLTGSARFYKGRWSRWTADKRFPQAWSRRIP